ncbi:MAG TPA: ABC transporter permease subunit [Microvirga sp.]|jgi:NitT/TauT family transport system permease protein|nr:ABC transporter permease subunit [Microvirga sp.]
MRSASLRALVLPAALLALAEIAARISGMQSDSLAPPSAVALAFMGAVADGSLAGATGDTLLTAFGGLALGGGIGLMLGVLFGLVPVLDRLMELTLETVRPIPSVALIPIALIALGFGYRMEIAIVSFACVWPVLILTRSAIAGIEPRLLEVARALRLTLAQRIVKIVLPAALPRIVVAFRLAAGIALVVAVTVEIAANPQGLGHAIMASQQALQPAAMLAYLAWLGVVGFTLNLLLVKAQQRLLGRAAQAGTAR